MRRLAGVLIVTISMLGLAGCDGPPTSQSQQEQNAQDAALGFDALLSATKVVMTTKPGSDLPKNFTYEGTDVLPKVEKLVSTLKKAKKLPASEALQKLPDVIFLFDVNGGKKNLNVFPDRFEYGGQWYKLDMAPEATYSAFEVLENEEIPAAAK